MVGAHTCNPEQPPQKCHDLRQRMDYQLRNLFWVCYALDKELSLRTGQPPSINDDHCDLSLPPDYGKHLQVPFRTHYVSSESMIEIPLLGDFRLSKIKARAYTMLYSVGALRKSDAEVLKAIRELDNELETWRLSLPQKCRPTLSFSKGSPITEGDLDMQAVMLRLEYHHCMAIIHQASGRCVAWTNNHNGIMEGVSSSLALSVEACRSSLAYLQTAQHVLPADSFWYVLNFFCSFFTKTKLIMTQARSLLPHVRSPHALLQHPPEPPRQPCCRRPGASQECPSAHQSPAHPPANRERNHAYQAPR